MAACKARVRIFARIDNDGKYLTGKGSGHYDLQILADGKIDERPYENPIISYGHKGESEIAFFEEGRENTLYSGYRVDMYHWDFDTTTDEVKAAIKKLGGYLERTSINDNSIGKLAKYDVTSGPFVTYSYDNSNCFIAVATLCKWLGDTKLMEIYEQNDGKGEYVNYMPYNLIPDYKKHWKHDGIITFG